ETDAVAGRRLVEIKSATKRVEAVCLLSRDGGSTPPGSIANLFCRMLHRVEKPRNLRGFFLFWVSGLGAFTSRMAAPRHAGAGKCPRPSPDLLGQGKDRKMPAPRWSGESPGAGVTSAVKRSHGLRY